MTLYTFVLNFMQIFLKVWGNNFLMKLDIFLLFDHDHRIFNIIN